MFYFKYKPNDYKTFFLKSHSLILYFHIFYIKHRFLDEEIQFIDNFYSWNSNLKKEYNFQRETINQNVYKVNYNLKNQFILANGHPSENVYVTALVIL